VLYRQGAPLSYYIDNAGGYARFADRRGVNATPTAPARSWSGRWASGGNPGRRPGSVVTVSALRDEDRFVTVGLIRDLARSAVR
jgi:hypothetical protein